MMWMMMMTMFFVLFLRFFLLHLLTWWAKRSTIDHHIWTAFQAAEWHVMSILVIFLDLEWSKIEITKLVSHTKKLFTFAHTLTWLRTDGDICGELDDTPGTLRTSLSVPCSPLITELLLTELKLWLLSSCRLELECFLSLCFLCFFELPILNGQTLRRRWTDGLLMNWFND